MQGTSLRASLRSVPEQASTIAFMTLAFAKIAHLGNARSDGHVLAPARAGANRFALVGLAVAVCLQLVTTIQPLARNDHDGDSWLDARMSRLHATRGVNHLSRLSRTTDPRA